MRPYLALFSARFRLLLQYRAAAWAGVATQVFWGIIRCAIFAAFYRSATAPQPMTLAEVLDYVWLGQALLLVMMLGVDRDVADMIRGGTVAYELLRPVDLYGWWLARAIAARTAPVLLRAVPQFVVAGLLFDLRAPAGVASGAAFAVAMAGAVLVSSAMATLLTLTMLWTVAGDGAARIAPIFQWLFSGMLIPLPLFPDWAQGWLRWLPYAGMGDLPFRLYSGNLPPGAVWGVLAHQCGWSAVLILIGGALLRRGTRRLTVQGG